MTPKSEDFSRWYLDVVAKAELADYGPVRCVCGCVCRHDFVEFINILVCLKMQEQCSICASITPQQPPARGPD